MRRSVRIVLFATDREAVGRPSIDLSVPADGLPVGGLLASLGREHRALAALLPACRIARNGRYVSSPTARVRPGDEVAIHPPYSGG